MLREYQEEIARLRAALEGRPLPAAAAMTLSDDEMSKLRQEIEEQIKMSWTATGISELSTEQLAQVPTLLIPRCCHFHLANMMQHCSSCS
jgi:hypothetical protein